MATRKTRCIAGSERKYSEAEAKKLIKQLRTISGNVNHGEWELFVKNSGPYYEVWQTLEEYELEPDVPRQKSTYSLEAALAITNDAIKMLRGNSDALHASARLHEAKNELLAAIHALKGLN